ncbi:hypothetical protein OIU77_019711 [Salix suchowensis]|uniref:Uncharacterized protein n=1 Tax=Salix suchowensis TaxID=1278906 RepID=A0ABQ9CLI9_9ROSI|nr:hypothetical protein OIU77_019711 [Salix suchowensis]
MEPVGVKVNKDKEHAGEEMARAEIETCRKLKNGSVFPKKKRLVQTMMLDSLISAFKPSSGTTHFSNGERK